MRMGDMPMSEFDVSTGPVLHFCRSNPKTRCLSFATFFQEANGNQWLLNRVPRYFQRNRECAQCHGTSARAVAQGTSFNMSQAIASEFRHPRPPESATASNGLFLTSFGERHH